MRAYSNFLFLSALLLAGGSTVFAQTPVIFQGGVLNAASGDKTGQPVAPGSLVSIYGTNLTAATLGADSIPLSTTLSGVSVKFNNTDAPMLYVGHDVAGAGSYDLVNVQLPWEAVAITPPTTSATVQMVVSRNGVPSAPMNVSVAPAAPGIFTFGGGAGQAVAYGNLDGATAAPVGSGAPSFSPPHPAKIGDPATLAILATGLGPVEVTPKSGGIPPTGLISNTLTKPIVTVGGVAAQVVFSGLYPYAPGVYQVNIIIAPGTPTGDAIPLQFEMNGIKTRADATIAVSQ